MIWIDPTPSMRIENLRKELARMMKAARRGTLTKSLVEMNDNVKDLVKLCPRAVARRALEVARKIVYQAHLVAINRSFRLAGLPKIQFVPMNYKSRQMMGN